MKRTEMWLRKVPPRKDNGFNTTAFWRNWKILGV